MSGRRPAVAFDHVLMGTPDCAAAGARLTGEHGLAAVEGGRHTGWGTANWIVPLGSSYIEVVSIVDAVAATTNPFGQRVQRAIAAGEGLFAWCVAPTDFDGTVARLGLEASAGSRTRPDGSLVRWLVAGLEVALADPSRPFFIAWDIPKAEHPGRARATHRVRPEGIAWVEVRGDAATIRSWLGDDALSVKVRPGPPALLAVGIATDQGEIVLG